MRRSIVVANSAKLRFRLPAKTAHASLLLLSQSGPAVVDPLWVPFVGPRAAAHKRGKRNPRQTAGISAKSKNYSSMSITTPEPTVRPPSRMAKRRPFSMAMGVISSTFMSTLSPGMHISVPSGRVMMPVTSVVRK